MSEEMKEDRVLALKYRPKKFEDLVGQSTISQTLCLALDSNRLSHAYLFSGLRGSGKTSTARIMAKSLLCSKGLTSKPCEVCENCKSANDNRHLDIIEMDAASNRGIDDIKELIEHTKYMPSSSRFKIFIIDEVHMLTTQAFNALLKTLEEPPSFVKFILATTDPLKLPATILSRTQHFRFNKISNKDVIHHLSYILNKEKIDYDLDALEILARTGQGSLRDTLTLLDQSIIFSKGRVNTFSVVEMLGLIEPKVMDEIFDIVLNKKDITPLITKLEEYELSQVCDEMTIYLKEKMLEKNAKFDLLIFDRFFRILGEAKQLLSLNSDENFVLILSLLKMQEATSLKPIQDLINEVEEINVEKPSSKKIEIQASNVNIKENNINIKKEIVSSEEQSSKIEFKKPTHNDPNIEEKEVISSLNSDNEVNFITPFDENFDKPLEKKQLDEQNPLQENSSDDVLKEAISNHLEKQKDKNELLYEKVINKIYDRDIRLGECFEDNFVFKSYENNKLTIISYAKGEDRKFLFKYFGILKTFIYDIFGDTLELEFIKDEIEVKNEKKDLNINNSTKKIEKKDLKTPQIIEDDLEGGSGCVATMNNSSKVNPSQEELEINDVLNSKMLDKAKEIFDIKKITVKTKT